MKLTEKQPEVRGLRRVVIVVAVLAFGVATCCSALALHIRVGTGSAPGAKSADSGKAVKIPSGVRTGTLLTRVDPVYPAAARKAKIQGSVVLHAVIGKDGSIANLQAVSGPEELRQSAIDAVRQWTYEPYLLNGEPVEVETMIQVTYSMTD